MARVKEITGGEGAWAGLDPMAGTFTGTVRPSGDSPTACLHRVDMLGRRKTVTGAPRRGWLPWPAPSPAWCVLADCSPVTSSHCPEQNINSTKAKLIACRQLRSRVC